MKGPIGELLRTTDFLRLWLVGATANAMRWLELLASGLFAWEITHSAIMVTVVVAARQLPQLAFGAFAGAISEAVNRKTIVLLALLVPALVSTSLATLATVGHLALWHVILGNFVSGTMWATEMSTRRRMVGEVAGPQRTVPAIALDSATNAATRMIGPLLGGIVFGWLGMKGAYTATALVQFTGAFVLAGLVHPQTPRRLDLARIPADIAEGLSFAWTRPTILLVYGVTIVTNLRTRAGWVAVYKRAKTPPWQIPSRSTLRRPATARMARCNRPCSHCARVRAWSSGAGSPQSRRYTSRPAATNPSTSEWPGSRSRIEGRLIWA